MKTLNVIHNLDGGKNSVISITGTLTEPLPFSQVLTFAKLQPPPSDMRLGAVSFAVEEKLGLRLYWTAGKKSHYILSLESRGYFDFQKFQAIHSSKYASDVDGIGLESFNWNDKLIGDEKRFFVQLELVKQ